MPRSGVHPYNLLSIQILPQGTTPTSSVASGLSDLSDLSSLDPDDDPRED
jgi:hypothetical protein